MPFPLNVAPVTRTAPTAVVMPQKPLNSLLIRREPSATRIWRPEELQPRVTFSAPTVAVMPGVRALGGSGGGPKPGEDYHRYLGDKVGQLWPRRSLNVQEVDMGYIFRGVARGATLTDQVQTLLTIDLSAGDSNAFSGSGTTAITYTGPPMSMLLTGQLKFAVNGVGARRLGLLHNGVEVAFERANPDATSSYTTTLAWPIVVQDGDTFGMRAYQNSGGALDVSEGQLRGVIVGEWQ